MDIYAGEKNFLERGSVGHQKRSANPFPYRFRRGIKKNLDWSKTFQESIFIEFLSYKFFKFSAKFYKGGVLVPVLDNSLTFGKK